MCVGDPRGGRGEDREQGGDILGSIHSTQGHEKDNLKMKTEWQWWIWMCLNSYCNESNMKSWRILNGDRLKSVLVFDFLICNWVSCSLGYIWVHSVSGAGLELLILHHSLFSARIADVSHHACFLLSRNKNSLPILSLHPPLSPQYVRFKVRTMMISSKQV